MKESIRNINIFPPLMEMDIPDWLHAKNLCFLPDFIVHLKTIAAHLMVEGTDLDIINAVIESVRCPGKYSVVSG